MYTSYYVLLNLWFSPLLQAPRPLPFLHSSNRAHQHGSVLGMLGKVSTQTTGSSWLQGCLSKPYVRFLARLFLLGGVPQYFLHQEKTHSGVLLFRYDGRDCRTQPWLCSLPHIQHLLLAIWPSKYFPHLLRASASQICLWEESPGALIKYMNCLVLLQAHWIRILKEGYQEFVFSKGPKVILPGKYEKYTKPLSIFLSGLLQKLSS